MLKLKFESTSVTHSNESSQSTELFTSVGETAKNVVRNVFILNQGNINAIKSTKVNTIRYVLVNSGYFSISIQSYFRNNSFTAGTALFIRTFMFTVPFCLRF